jgi:phosphoglycerate dehydrogenase-like enzyme
MLPNFSLSLAVLCLVTVTTAHAESSIEEIIEEAGLAEGPAPVREHDGWRPPEKIVVRDGYGIVERLQAAFPEVEFVGVRNSAEAASAVRNADALIGFCEPEIVSRADRLVWIQIFSAGAENCVTVDVVAERQVLLTNMQKMASPVIGEHAIAMMMALARGLPQFARAMPDGDWDEQLAERANMRSVAGKTMLVVGLGGIGTAVARRAEGLRMRVVATRNSSRSGPDFVDYVGLSDELLTLAAEADVVVNALPLTPQTADLFDREFFDTVKPGVLFINVARGGSVVTAELVAALKDGRVAAAGLYVTEPEPLPADHPLWQMPNVIITPHVAGFGNERDDYPVVFEENVRRFVAGEPLLNVVDPERGY